MPAVVIFFIGGGGEQDQWWWTCAEHPVHREGFYSLERAEGAAEEHNTYYHSPVKAARKT